MLKRIHPITGVIGFLTILTFWTTTVASELFGSSEAVALVKQSIPWGFLVLVPALAIAGASGFAVSRNWKDPRIAKKQRRMPFIAANGIVILIPAALYLSVLASRRDFGALFYTVKRSNSSPAALISRSWRSTYATVCV